MGLNLPVNMEGFHRASRNSKTICKMCRDNYCGSPKVHKNRPLIAFVVYEVYMYSKSLFIDY